MREVLRTGTWHATLLWVHDVSGSAADADADRRVLLCTYFVYLTYFSLSCGIPHRYYLATTGL